MTYDQERGEAPIKLLSSYIVNLIEFISDRLDLQKLSLHVFVKQTSYWNKIFFPKPRITPKLIHNFITAFSAVKK